MAERALAGTALQRLGEFIALIQAALFALLGMLHVGVDLTFGSLTVDEPVRIPAAIVELALGLGLFLSVLLPGRGALRAGRVIGAQSLTVMGVLIGQVLLAYGIGSRTVTNDVVYVVLLALSFTSMLLVAWPRVPRPANVL